MGIILMVGAFGSYVLAFLSQKFAWKWGFTDKPSGGRKIHTEEIPLLGGTGIGAVIALLIVGGWHLGWLNDPHLSRWQLLGFLIGIIILTVVGLLDDKYDLRPSIRFPIYALVAVIVVASGTTIDQVTSLSGAGGVSLDWWNVLGIHLPADGLAFIWMMLVLFAVKLGDGLDGLVTGQTIIGSAIIGGLAVTTAFFQPLVALLAMMVLAAYLGFFPHNTYPAKQFLGESGSVLAGYCLAFLAMVSGTKVATALMVLGLPLIDILLVIGGRLRRGVPVWQGDRTHLHHKLLDAGLSQTQAVSLIWFISIVFGLSALGLQTRGKLFLLLGLFVVTLIISFMAGLVAKRKAQV